MEFEKTVEEIEEGGKKVVKGLKFTTVFAMIFTAVMVACITAAAIGATLKFLFWLF